MQTDTWSGFLNRLAVLVGGGIGGFVHVETRTVADDAGDRGDVAAPTYVAQGD